jgi:hypothetical protein
VLHRIVTGTSNVGSVQLEPPHAWVGWQHDEPGIWPPPDDLDVSLNDYMHPFIDELGARARARLLRDDGRRVIGHDDLWQPNLRWVEDRLHVVFDWDSLASLSEAALAGATAAQFSSSETYHPPSMAESEAFLAAYAGLRGRSWSGDELEVCWAAAVWLIAFNAKKYAVAGWDRSPVAHLEAHAEEMLRRAGA